MRRNDRSDERDYYETSGRGDGRDANINPPNNNFDRAYDSTNYGSRNAPEYPRRERGYADKQANNASRRRYEEEYRPIEDMQIHEREPRNERPQELRPQETSSGASNVVVSYPKSYAEVKQLIDSLRMQQAIIVDIIKLDTEDSQRVLDFMTGANYALGGSMQRLNTTMFLFTPGGVSIKIPFDVNKRGNKN